MYGATVKNCENWKMYSTHTVYLFYKEKTIIYLYTFTRLEFVIKTLYYAVRPEFLNSWLKKFVH
jgi:hypothetical protein